MTQTPAAEAIRVFVVDDHPMVRRGLAALVSDAGYRFVGEAADGHEAVQLIPDIQPDVVLLDLMMPRMDGVSVIVNLAPRLPRTRFVMLTSTADPQEIRRAIDAGASGYLLKTAGSQELVSVIAAAHAGRQVLGAEAAEALQAQRHRRPPGHDLTARELELLACMARGLGNQEIAAELQISVPTVKYHVTNILAKLHANNRTEAVLTALKFRLVPAA
jgi:NarL family two-component system response regulator LiaR